MKKKNINPNTKLLFKQGIKSVFTFKIQFLSVLLICFVGTVLITASISSIRRLEKSYDQIVGSVDKFDSSIHLEVGQSGAKLSNDQLFLPLADLLPMFYTGIKNSTSSTYNFNILDQDNWLGRAILSDSFKDVFNSKMDEAKNGADKNPNLEKWNDIFVNQLISDLDVISQGKNSYLDETTIGVYTRQNPYWYKAIRNYNSSTEQDKFTWSDKNEYNRYRSSISEHPDEFKKLSYLYFSSETISRYIYKIATDLKFSNQLNHYSDTNSIYETLFKKENMISNSDLQFEYNEVLSKDKKEKQWLVIDKQNFDKYTESEKQALINKTLIKKGLNQVINPMIVLTRKNQKDEVVVVDTLQAFKTNVLEGFDDGVGTRPKQYVEANLNKSISVFADEFADIGYNGNKFYESNAKWISSEHVTADLLPFTASYLMHVDLASKASNAEVYVRQEMVFNDPKTQIKYRTVIIDDSKEEFTNFQMVAGSQPKGANEIAVTNQFAKTNHLRIGDIININSKLFTISGFASDAFSFFPTSDPNVPIPNPKVGTIVYGTTQGINRLYNGGISRSSSNEYLNFFLYGDEQQINNFQYYMNASKFYIDKNQEAKLTSSEIVTFYQQTAFEDSLYATNWTLFISIFKTYKMIVYIITALIAFVAIISLYICIRKTINYFSKQIGILKSMGLGAYKIAISYISYSVLIAAIVIPLGWIVGTMLQSPFIAIFAGYFNIQIGRWMFDYVSILISIGCFAVLTGMVSYFAAWWIIRKPVMKVVRQEDKWSNPVFVSWLNRTILSRVNFDFRISTKISASGKKQIFTLIFLIFVSSFFVSSGVLMPAVVVNAKNKYFENIKYANTVDVVEPIANMPLSKTSISMWSGQEDNNMNELDYHNSKINYYSDPNLYSASLANSSTIPPYIYAKEGVIETPYENIIKNTINGEGDLYSKFLAYTANQLGITSGRSISVGMVEQFIGYIFNLENIPGATEKISEQERINLFNQILKPLTNVISRLLQILLDDAPPIESGYDWRDQFLGILLENAPPFIKGYLNSIERKEQFAFGFESTSMIPKQDTLATTIKDYNFVDKSFNQQIIGLDKQQNAYKLTDEAKEKTFLSTQNLELLKKLFNSKTEFDQNIVQDGLMLYDAQTKILNIPIIIGKQTNAMYGFDIGYQFKDFSSQSKKLFVHKNDIPTILPTQAWVYDDTDFMSSDYYEQNLKGSLSNIPKIEEDQKYYTNLENIDLNKFTYNRQYDSNNKLLSEENREVGSMGSYMFENFEIDKNNEIKSAYLRPFYEWKNVNLFIPTEIIDVGLYKHLATKTSDKWKDVYTIIDGDGETSVEEHDSVFYNQTLKVPDFVKQSYKDELGNNFESKSWIVIKPYDASISNKNYTGDLDALLVNKKTYSFIKLIQERYQIWIRNIMEKRD